MARLEGLARKDLERIFRRGVRLSSDSFRIVVSSSGQDRRRLAVIVGRSADQRAVVRNRLRRRCREYVRVHQTLLPSGRDVAITLTKRAGALSRRDFYAALHDILLRIP